MKSFADGVFEDSKRIEELKKSGAFDEPIIVTKDSLSQNIVDSTSQKESDPFSGIHIWRFLKVREDTILG